MIILSKLIESITPLELHGQMDREITGLCYDSRKSGPGSLFVAIPGEHTDGHKFISVALKKGASAILHEQKLESYDPSAAYIRVESCQKALAALAAAFYRRPSKEITLIGVTGTNGKTTTSILIHSFLEEIFESSGLIGTLEYRIGKQRLPAPHTTPQSLELQELLRNMADQKIAHCVMEVSSHSLVQHRVAGLDYRVAIFTNLTQDHLDYHKNMDEYLEAKLLLFKGLSPGSTAVINLDDPYGHRFTEASRGIVITFGLSEKAMIRAEKIELISAGARYTLVTPRGRFHIESPLVGRFNIYNNLAAVGAAFALDLPMDRVLSALGKVATVPGRMERVTAPGSPFTVVVDYAHTPDGLEKVLKTARSFTKNRLIVLFGCGGDRDRTKRPIMGRIAVNEGDLIYITSDNPRNEEPTAILREIEKGAHEALALEPNRDKTHILEVDRKKAIESAISQAKEGDVVVLAGKGHETYQIFKDRTIHFDDREVAREFLAVKS